MNNNNKDSDLQQNDLKFDQNFSKTVKPFSSIPGPWPSLPIIGTRWDNFYYSFVGKYDLSKLHEVYLQKYRVYGPIFKEEYQWHNPIVHIFDPNDYETVFRNQGRCPIRPANEFVSYFRSSNPSRYPNIGLANLNGEEWLLQRHRLAPAIMKLRTINESMENQNIICEDFLNYLWNSRDPQTNIVENIQEATYKLALESICMLCLDCRIGSFETSDDKSSDAQNLIESTKLLFETFNKLYYGFSWWKIFRTNAYDDLDRAESEIYEISSKYIEKAIDDLMNETSGEHTVLRTMLNTEGLSLEEVKITIIDLIIGGIFTVSNMFAYLFYQLAANPEEQQKLFEEISASIGSSNEEGFSLTKKILVDHIAQMPYLKACVQESFRLNCPVPGIMRITTKSMVLSGYEIPKNTIVFSHFMTTCRLEEYFERSDEFYPERWIDPSKRNHIHSFSLLPFGYGNRMCIGKRFSESEIYLSLAKLIYSYKLELVPDHETLELKHAFMVIPAHPISIKLVQR